MRGYLFGIQRFFKSAWAYNLNLISGPIFNCPSQGLLAICDNLFSSQQSRGFVMKSHNVLTISDVRKLYLSPQLSPLLAHSFMTRVVFGVALMTAMRPTELHLLRLSQISTVHNNREDVLCVKGRLGSLDVISKAARGGCKNVKYNTAWY